MIATHNIKSIKFRQDHIILSIDDNELIIPLEQLSARLKAANETERNMFKISPSGYGIHWPLIDEELSIEGILRDFSK